MDRTCRGNPLRTSCLQRLSLALAMGLIVVTLAACSYGYKTVTFAPTDMPTHPDDWQTVKAGAHAPKQTVACADGHLYLTPVRPETPTDFNYPGEGLWEYDGETWQEHFPDDYVIVFCAPDGAVRAWVLEMDKYKGGDYDAIVDPLYLHEGGQWTLIDAEADSEGIHDQLYRASHWASDADLVVDGQGDLWLSYGLTYGPMNPGYGVLRYDGESWHQVVPSSIRQRVRKAQQEDGDFVELAGLVGMDVMDLEVGPDGTVWFFTAANGISSFDGEEWRSYPAHFDDDLAIYGVVDAQGGVWVNAADGVMHKDGDAWTHFRSQGSVNIAPVAADPAGPVWFEESRESAPDALLRYDGAAWLRYEFPTQVKRTDSPAFTSRRDAVVGPDGALWMRGGLRFLPGGPRLDALPEE